MVDFNAALQIGKSIEEWKKKAWLISSLLVNLGALAYFKYANFFLENVHVLVGGDNSYIPLEIILPVGISFYTFQTMSYTIDVYNGRIKPTHNWLDFANYVAFFPQLVAGPIERSKSLLPQLQAFRTPSREQIVSGARLIVWGLFKKMVIADRLAVYVDALFNAPQLYSSLALALGVVFFAFQIYCDFSGYSDIAIGVASLMGVELMINFRRPYFAKNLREFWSRWHISLSQWFRDYVYIPLGGNRKGDMATRINILLVFVLSGFWHGANWNFIIWGGIHGLFLVVQQAIGKRIFINPMTDLVRMALNFAIVCFAWIFFRADSLEIALDVVHRISLLQVDGPITAGAFGYFSMALSVVMIVALVVIEWMEEKELIKGMSANLVSLFSLLSVLCLSSPSGAQFIYFQF